MAELSMDIGLGGWARLARPEFAPHRVFVRFERSASGRLAIAELRLAGAFVTAEVLRSIPVGRIEALANAPGAVTALANSLAEALPTGAHEDAEDILVPPSAVKAGAFLIGPSDSAPAVIGGPAASAMTAGAVIGGPAVTVVAGRRRQLRLAIPDVKVKPDSFYRRVAEMYTDVAARSSKPAALIAEANGVPPTTVHGWVKEARRRGLLAPGERQRRTNG